MHACGHDTHIAILMGIAEIMFKNKDKINGTIKFIFQPAEEGPPAGEEGGSELMVKEGVLKIPDVDAIFALHIDSEIPVEALSYKPEGIMAASQSFKIVVNGK
jgi:amidohydrolase